MLIAKLSDLQSEIECLDNALADLEKTLGPVLSPAKEIPNPSNSLPSSDCSEAVRQADNLIGRINATRINLLAITSRIQL